MLNRLRTLFKPATAERPPASVPAGERYYVVGDIHGRLDLFEALIAAIEAQEAVLSPADTTMVLLGDLVDRGPDSAGVIDRAMAWAAARRVRCIAGNHEEMFLRSFDDVGTLRHFLRYGGRETILSYGLDQGRYEGFDLQELQDVMRDLVPAHHRAFLEGLEDIIVAGDYLFVHAGVDPDRSIEEQKTGDLRWIRERFLDSDKAFSHVVIHGHTIFDDVDDAGTRIGIDTGAYATGRLTALVLEGAEKHCLQAVDRNGEIAVERQALP